jgi:hypothetical protein
MPEEYQWNLEKGHFLVKSMYQALIQVDAPINNKKNKKIKF